MAQTNESQSMQILRMGVRGMSHGLNVLCGQLQDLSLSQLEKLLPGYDPREWDDSFSQEYKNAPEQLIKTLILNAFFDNIRDMTKEEAVDELSFLVMDLLKEAVE
tara:strand:- start:415 stop:729 length:315 start_codon:yes stop_codon:yes gene_type:complete